MADATEPTTTEPTGEDAEKHFWEVHAEKTRGILDKWFEDKKTELSKSRGPGRTTLPGILADLVFGPDKK